MAGRRGKTPLKTYTTRVTLPTAEAFNKLLEQNKISYLQLFRRVIEKWVANGEIPLEFLDDGRTDEELFHVIEEAELAKKILASRKQDK